MRITLKVLYLRSWWRSLLKSLRFPISAFKEVQVNLAFILDIDTGNYVLKNDDWQLSGVCLPTGEFTVHCTDPRILGYDAVMKRTTSNRPKEKSDCEQISDSA